MSNNNENDDYDKDLIRGLLPRLPGGMICCNALLD